MADHDGVPKHNDTRVILYSLIIALAACNFGFAQSTTGGFLAMPTFQLHFGTYDPVTGTTALSAGRQTLMYGLEVAFITLGSISTGFISIRFGRKVGLYLCAVFGVAGLLVQLVSNYAAVVAGRSIMGVGIGIAAAYSIAFWSEISPPRLRGMIVVLYQFSINISNFLGSCVDQGTHKMANAWSYRIPLLTVIAIPVLLMCLLWMVPESPRWLVTIGKNEEARRNLAKLRGPTYTEDELDQELTDCIRFTEIESAADASSSYAECFKGTNLRRTAIASLMMAGQQCMGVAFLAGYVTYFFALVGNNDAFLSSVIANAMSVAGTVAAFPLVKVSSRRTVMVVGAIVSGACMLLFAIVAEAAPDSKAAGKTIVACICIFNFSYSASWGSFGPIVMGEIPSNKLRSKTVAIAAGLGFTLALIVITTIPYLIGAEYANLGTRLGFIFGGLTVIITILTYFYLPETKDRSLEEIDEMFIKSVPSRKFQTYQCTHEVFIGGDDAGSERLSGGKMLQSHIESS